MAESKAAELESIIEPVVRGMGFELVRVAYGGGQRPVLQVMAERPDGSMSIDDCAKLSQELSVILDIENPLPGEYVLEVSSPGIDRPLTRLKDFERFAGYDAKVELRAPIAGRRRWRGVLGGVEKGRIVLDEEGEKHIFDFAEIRRAKLIMTDSLLSGGNAESKTGQAK